MLCYFIIPSVPSTFNFNPIRGLVFPQSPLKVISRLLDVWIFVAFLHSSSQIIKKHEIQVLQINYRGNAQIDKLLWLTISVPIVNSKSGFRRIYTILDKRKRVIYTLTPERMELISPWNAYHGFGSRVLSGPLAHSRGYIEVKNELADCSSDIFLSIKKNFNPTKWLVVEEKSIFPTSLFSRIIYMKKFGQIFFWSKNENKEKKQ